MLGHYIKAKDQQRLYIRWCSCKFSSYFYKENAELHLCYRIKLTFFWQSVNRLLSICADRCVRLRLSISRRAPSITASLKRTHIYLKMLYFACWKTARAVLLKVPRKCMSIHACKIARHLSTQFSSNFLSLIMFNLCARCWRICMWISFKSARGNYSRQVRPIGCAQVGIWIGRAGH